jgi:hypothetical protein
VNVMSVTPQSVDQVRTALTNWFRNVGASGQVAFREASDPPADPYDDYVVVYKATFEPVDLEMARMEIWQTAKGNVALGLEKRDRIAKRLGVKGTQTGFAAGHEPRAVSVPDLLSLLDGAAEGRLAIIVKANRLFGVWSTKAAMDSELYDRLKAAGHRDLGWIVRLDHKAGQILRFRPWREA